MKRIFIDHWYHHFCLTLNRWLYSPFFVCFPSTTTPHLYTEKEFFLNPILIGYKIIVYPIDNNMSLGYMCCTIDYYFFSSYYYYKFHLILFIFIIEIIHSIHYSLQWYVHFSSIQFNSIHNRIYSELTIRSNFSFHYLKEKVLIIIIKKNGWN